MEQVQCNLCGENKPVPFITSKDRFSGKVFILSKCANCNLVYLTPRPDPSELIMYYPDDYEAFIHPDRSDLQITIRDYSNILGKQLDFIEHYHPQRGRLLDIGCATGDFLNTAQMRGWQVLGIEIMEKAADIARKKFNLEILTTDLEGSSIDEFSLHVVTLWDVLEHLPDPCGAMKKIHEILEPGGMVFISIPNLQSYDRSLFGTEWIGWDPPRHFTLFDSTTFRQLLSQAGFRIIAQNCLSGGKGTFFLSMDRVINKSPSRQWLKHLYPIINLVFWPYRKYSYWRLRGPIMYYALEKV